MKKIEKLKSELTDVKLIPVDFEDLIYVGFREWDEDLKNNNLGVDEVKIEERNFLKMLSEVEVYHKEKQAKDHEKLTRDVKKMGGKEKEVKEGLELFDQFNKVNIFDHINHYKKLLDDRLKPKEVIMTSLSSPKEKTELSKKQIRKENKPPESPRV